MGVERWSGMVGKGKGGGEGQGGGKGLADSGVGGIDESGRALIGIPKTAEIGEGRSRR